MKDLILKHRRTLCILMVGYVAMPFFLLRQEGLGYDDFTVGYYKAQGADPASYRSDRWLYKDWLVAAYKPFTILNERQGRIAFELLIIGAWIALVRKLPDTWMGEALFIASFYPMFPCMEFDNVGGILPILCISPIGSLVAGLFKPYLFVFSGIHAIGFGLAAYHDRQFRMDKVPEPIRD